MKAKKQKLLIVLLAFIWHLTAYSQAVYVDSNVGNDKNPGTRESPVFSVDKAVEIIKSKQNNSYTIKINPGIYVLNKPVSVSTEKDITNKRIVIEATVLPDDSSWIPEKMPVIISISGKGEVPGENYHFVVSFLINENNVTIRGLKFPGYFYPNTRYFPIARFNKSKTDLLVEQCLFVGDDDASHIQVGIIAHGNKIRIDHCIFYKARNSAVFWQDSGDGLKSGNGITNSIIYGASQSGVWTAWPDKDFLFKNNIVSNCKHFWIKNQENPTVYSIDSCLIVNNRFYQAIAGSNVIPEKFELKENNVLKEGEIALRQKEADVHKPLPIDYLHVIQSSPGYNLRAGLFKNR